MSFAFEEYTTSTSSLGNGITSINHKMVPNGSSGLFTIRGVKSSNFDGKDYQSRPTKFVEILRNTDRISPLATSGRWFTFTGSPTITGGAFNIPNVVDNKANLHTITLMGADVMTAGSTFVGGALSSLGYGSIPLDMSGIDYLIDKPKSLYIYSPGDPYDAYGSHLTHNWDSLIQTHWVLPGMNVAHHSQSGHSHQGGSLFVGGPSVREPTSLSPYRNMICGAMGSRRCINQLSLSSTSGSCNISLSDGSCIYNDPLMRNPTVSIDSFSFTGIAQQEIDWEYGIWLKIRNGALGTPVSNPYFDIDLVTTYQRYGLSNSFDIERVSFTAGGTVEDTTTDPSLYQFFSGSGTTTTTNAPAFTHTVSGAFSSSYTNTYGSYGFYTRFHYTPVIARHFPIGGIFGTDWMPGVGRPIQAFS